MSNIQSVVNDLQRVLACKMIDYLIIDDGSSDRTLQVCRENNYHILSIPLNLGLAGAFQTGMKYALYNNFTYAIQFDGDGQHNAAYIPPMIAAADLGENDIVIGSRYLKEKKPFSVRMLGSRLITICIRITTGRTIKDPTSGMRLYNKRAIQRFASDTNLPPEPDAIAYLLRCGYKVVEIPVKMNERGSGESYLGAMNSIRYMFRVCSSILLAQWFRWKVK